VVWGITNSIHAVLVPRHVNGEKRHWPVMNATHGIMHHVQGSTHKNTQDLQTHLFPESLSSGSRVDALLRTSEHDDALLRASELDINE
jgi:hypothetical protein